MPEIALEEVCLWMEWISRKGLATLDVVKQRHEAIIHVQLLVAVKKS